MLIFNIRTNIELLAFDVPFDLKDLEYEKFCPMQHLYRDSLMEKWPTMFHEDFAGKNIFHTIHFKERGCFHYNENCRSTTEQTSLFT